MDCAEGALQYRGLVCHSLTLGLNVPVSFYINIAVLALAVLSLS